MCCLSSRLTAFISLLFGFGLLLALQYPLHAAVQSSSKQFVEVPAGKSVDVKEVYGTSHALLIGINRYKNAPAGLQLHYAVKDVEDLKQVLMKSYGFQAENITVLKDEEATLANIRHALSSLANKQKVKSEDRLLVYFSGHGQTVPLPDSGDMGFLIPTDADVDFKDDTNVGPYLDTCLQMSEVWSRLDASPAKHVLLMADACYSGLLAAPRSPGGLNAASLQVWAGRRARQVITAGGKGETSEENSAVGHGVFTFQLLQELKARAQEPGSVFTTTELYSVLFPAVSNQTNGQQKPQMAKYKLEGEFLFITAGKNDKGNLPATKVNPKDGAEMILIPTGPFLMGDDDRKDNPRHTVTLSGYYIYKNLVTVKQFRKFDAAHSSKYDWDGNKPTWGWKDDHPMVRVTWEEADAYCKWAGGHLPTDAQWEKAARGTRGLKYPWGNDWDPGKLWASKSAIKDAGGTTAVGGYGISPYGCTDMAGNVYQWCADWHDENFWSGRAIEGVTDPQNQNIGDKKYRVLRGGSWVDTTPDFFRAADRYRDNPTFRNYNYGFRVASGLY